MGRDSLDEPPLSLERAGGFLDGEGCFQFGGSPCIAITNTYLPILRQFLEAWGGGIRPLSSKPHEKRKFQWELYGPRAVALCRALLPHLGEKQEQAAILTRIMDFPKHSAMRDFLARRLKALKYVCYPG